MYANRALPYLSVLRKTWGPIVVVQQFWCRKICQIVCRVSMKWIESTFLAQDVDEVFLVNKGIVIWCFVDRNYKKLLWRRETHGHIRVTKNGLGSGVDRMFKSSDSAFYHITDRLNPFGKSVEFDILFLGPLPLENMHRYHAGHTRKAPAEAEREFRQMWHRYKCKNSIRG